MQHSKVKVIDSIMGSGKTTWAIQHMMENQSDKRFVYVTPYLDEIKRIIDSCNNRHNRRFAQPNGSKQSKSEHLKTLLATEKDIACTHKLFECIDEEVLTLIKSGGYTLILDEVMKVIEETGIKGEECQRLFETGVLKKGEDISKDIFRIEAGETESLKRYTDIRKMAEMERLVMVDGHTLMWLFPAKVFSAFEEVYNLTYLFSGSMQKAFYDTFGIDYGFYSTEIDQENKRVDLRRYSEGKDKQIKDSIKCNIHLIKDARLNAIGDQKYAFSYSWFADRDGSIIKLLKRNLYTFFRSRVNGRSQDNMWCVFKDHKDRVKGKGYTNGFVSHNARATNEYRHKKNVAYCVNRFYRPYLKKFFQQQGVTLDQDQYALSEAIQWIWRSRIRERRGINLYIPSVRIRKLFTRWLNDKL
jgi:hypothetical protein